MKKTLLNLFFVSFLFVIAQSELFASTLSGQILVVRENAGTTPARTSVLLAGNGNTSCALNGWFAFESAHTGLGKNWTDLLVAARQSTRQVTIVGTGTCDSFGVERISFIDMK